MGKGERGGGRVGAAQGGEEPSSSFHHIFYSVFLRPELSSTWIFFRSFVNFHQFTAVPCAAKEQQVHPSLKIRKRSVWKQKNSASFRQSTLSLKGTHAHIFFNSINKQIKRLPSKPSPNYPDGARIMTRKVYGVNGNCFTCTETPRTITTPLPMSSLSWPRSL